MLAQVCFMAYAGEGMRSEHERLAVFRSDSGVTLSFGDATYFIEADDPFHNIALKALELNDYIPFYIEIAKRAGLGPEFRDALESLIEQTNSGD